MFAREYSAGRTEYFFSLPRKKDRLASLGYIFLPQNRFSRKLLVCARYLRYTRHILPFTDRSEKECNQKSAEANESIANYTGRDDSPPEKKAVQKATEATPKKETCKSLIAQVFQFYSNLDMCL